MRFWWHVLGGQSASGRGGRRSAVLQCIGRAGVYQVGVGSSGGGQRSVVSRAQVWQQEGRCEMDRRGCAADYAVDLMLYMVLLVGAFKGKR